MKAIYAGSFDPVTLGHLDLIRRASFLFDEVVVAVLNNPNKHCLFDAEERKHHLELVTKDLENVSVATFSGLLAEFAAQIGATVAIRGLRNVVDFASEYQMHVINHQLNPQIETVFLAADREHIALSSTNVKEVATFGGSIHGMVPEEIEPFIIEKYKK